MSPHSETPPAADRGRPKSDETDTHRISRFAHLPEAIALELFWSRKTKIDEHGNRVHWLRVVVRCPHCRRTHIHGYRPGLPCLPHCEPPLGNTDLSQYRIGTQKLPIPVTPADKRQTARKAAGS